MPPMIEVSFLARPHDASLAAAAHRWVARLEAVGLEVRRATVAVHAARRTTAVALEIELTDRVRASIHTEHADPYVAISDAFRAARHQLEPVHPAPPREPLLARRRPAMG